MAPKTPLLLVDNLFDTVNQYPRGAITVSQERFGHEGFRVADYRRERTSWQTAFPAPFATWTTVGDASWTPDSSPPPIRTPAHFICADGTPLDRIEDLSAAVVAQTYRVLTFTGDGTKGVRFRVARYSAYADHRIKVYDVAAAIMRLDVSINFTSATPTATIMSGAGTVLAVVPQGDGSFDIQCTAVGVIAAHTHVVIVDPAAGTASDMAGFELGAMQFWDAAPTYDKIIVDLGQGVARTADSIYLDRGHNLWGRVVNVWYSDTGISFTNLFSLAPPSPGTLGGDPAAGWSVTEEGACYAFLNPTTAHRYWMVEVGPGAGSPIVTGIILGQRTQLLGFSNTFDEDAGERTENSAVSTAGYRGTDRTYSWRTCDLGLALIGATEYDATIRALRRLLFERNQPVVIAMDYGTRPERAWMYQYDGKSWGMAKKRVHRDGRLRFREVGQSLS